MICLALALTQMDSLLDKVCARQHPCTALLPHSDLLLLLLFQCWPCAYVLMERRDEPSYVAGLSSINDAVGGNMHPVSLMADYEKAPHNAAKTIFPDIETSGCW